MDAPPLPRNPLISFTSRNAGSIPVTLNTLENSFAMKKIALALLLAFTMLPAASFAQVVVRIGPPPPIYEYRGAPPDRGYVWISVYHRYEGDHYVWTPATGTVRLKSTSAGLRTGRFIGATTGKCRKDSSGKPEGK